MVDSSQQRVKVIKIVWHSWLHDCIVELPLNILTLGATIIMNWHDNNACYWNLFLIGLYLFTTSHLFGYELALTQSHWWGYVHQCRTLRSAYCFFMNLHFYLHFEQLCQNAWLTIVVRGSTIPWLGLQSHDQQTSISQDGSPSNNFYPWFLISHVSPLSWLHQCSYSLKNIGGSWSIINQFEASLAISFGRCAQMAIDW